MSTPLHRIIEIAVRSAAGKGHRDQLRILHDCAECADTPQLKRSLQCLTTRSEILESEFRRFETNPDHEKI